MAAPDDRRPHPHPHGSVHLDEAHWAEAADHAELEGELTLEFVTDSARRVAELRGSDAPPVRLVVDIGCGPGVGTCELATRFPGARVIAVDSSPAMLERVERRAASQGLDARIRTHMAEMPGGLDDLGAADVVWASMSLHHVGNEVAALRVMRGLLAPGGLIAIAERPAPTRFLPEALDVGPPGLASRLERASEDWFAEMRAGLPDSVPSAALPSMLEAAGFAVIDTRIAHLRVDAPLPDGALRFALRQVRRGRERLSEYLDEDDLSALDVLSDVDDPRSIGHRADVFVEWSREIAIARPIPN